MSFESETNNLKISTSNDGEINFKFLYNFFIRNKKFIGSFSLIFLIIGSFFSLTAKRVWEGQFQIVVNNKDQANKQNLINPNLSDLIGTDRTRDLKTEVGILESPSILMPIYDFVVFKKNLNTKKNSLPFTKWKDSLEIELQKNTSILNIAYRDKDKNLVLSVLTKISDKYQDYAGENKLRLQKLMKDYLTEQIKIYKKKTSNSLKAAQEFAMEQDLIYFDPERINSNDLSKRVSNRNSLLNSDIENIRVQAANKLRKINLQLLKIEKIRLDEEKLKYLGSTIPKLVEEGLPAELIKIDNELISNRLKYTDNDITIKNILEKRRLLIRNIRDRAIGLLNAEKIEVEALMEAAMRPKGILLNYKELIRAAQRDENTLVSLENEKRLIDLEMAKSEDPWKLITKPTLLKDPVSPSKLFLSIASLLLGSILASLLAAFKESKSGKIYEAVFIEDLLKTSIIETLNSKELDTTNENFSYIKDFIISKSKSKKIFLISLGEIENQYLTTLKDFLTNEKTGDFEVSYVNNANNFEIIREEDFKIIIATLGYFTYRDIKNIRKKLNLYEIKLSGIILINS
tara:strand:+ start:144 stop:1862 length:1719 start_codon:yes stop_codon:yes gene_type:complete